MSQAVGELISVQEAIRIIDAVPVEPQVVRVALADAQGMILAEDLSTDRDYPPFDKSLMDGFAVRSADVRQTPTELQVMGELTPGMSSDRVLGLGQTMAIMTGAPLPAGADGVVPIEDVENPSAQAGQTLRVLHAQSPQQYVSRAGQDIRRGEIVLRTGQRIESPQLAVAASIGAATVSVYARPRVAVLSTGDEIVPFDRKPALAQIRGCNAIMLSALLRRLGCRPVDMGIARDDRERVRAALVKAMQLDALVASGGMSVGRHDHVPAVLRELGVQVAITRLRIKPGKPFIFGAIDRATLADRAAELGPMRVSGGTNGKCYIFGLPGNPVSGFVCTLLLASRLLSRLKGIQPRQFWQTATLAADIGANGDREFYQPVQIERTPEGLLVHPLEWKGSADVFTLARANGLLRRPIGDLARQAGASADVHAFEWDMP